MNGQRVRTELWLPLAFAFVGILLLRFIGRWPMAAVSGAAVLVSLIAAGSIHAAAFALRKAANARVDSFGLPVERERIERATATLERLPDHSRLALDVMVYWAGVAAALVFFTEHAAAAGWAAASAGMAAVSPLGRDSKWRTLVFSLASAPAMALSLLWLPPEAQLRIAFTTTALLVATGGAVATVAWIVSMRLKVSEALSIPAVTAMTVGSMTWFFVQSRGLGHEPTVVAWGAAVGVALALLGYALRAVDVAGAWTALFLMSRVYGFLGFLGSLPIIIAELSCWRPTPRGKAGAPRGMVEELAVGLVPMGLATGYFTFRHPVFLAGYAGSCAAIVAVSLMPMLDRWPRAGTLSLLGSTLAVSALPLVFGADYPLGTAGAAAAGALLVWALDHYVLSLAADWKDLNPSARKVVTAVLGAGATIGLGLVMAS